ncbi:MAG: UDP-N-acetylmuramate dehydrogenase [Planctomycetaceae bacterium]|jgi:UDP-N-acetylmuramate dehydrogenase|nr:UDP-N-acetylmuramate dehydrogenase [Planctomycetaceae bacterium]
MSDFPNFVRRNIPLAMLTRLQLGGTAEFFAEPPDEAALEGLLKQCRGEKIIRVLGTGANVLITAEQLGGIVIALTGPAFCDIRIDGTQITVGAGARLSQVITRAVSQGLSGIEGLIGLPGTFGGAVHENAGTNNGSIGQRIESVSVIDLYGKPAVLSGTDLEFWFQTGQFDNAVIVSAVLQLEQDDAAELTRRMQKHWIFRKAKQPAGELPSAMLFKNPRSGLPAEELIVQAGLKGTKIGGALISERNANFILVEPEGTANDVLRLLQFVQDEVRKLTEIELESAIEVW